jgi:antitoxin component YwqK of YwqJK toxin-antitoxin module
MKPHFFFMFLFFFSLQLQSSACSCSFDKYLTIEEYNNSALIFTGRVVRVDTVITKIDKTQKVHFVIDTLYKGNHTSDTVIVDARIYEGMCGIRFTLNEQRMIFTTYKNSFVNGKTTNERLLFTSLCYRNCKFNIDRSETGEIILNSNYQFLKQIQKHKNFTFDQYYLSQRSLFNNTYVETLYAKGEIKNGRASGTWYYYNSKKLLSKQTTFSSEGFIVEEIVYYPNGNIHYRRVYDIYGKDESFIEYDEKGTLVKQENADPNSTGIRKKVYYKPSESLTVIKY